MSVPGLQLVGELNQETEATVFTRKLAAENEWRFEVNHGQSIEVKILSGTAEIFGTELAIGNNYTFTGTKAAIYTWHGCELECRGLPTVEYSAEETPTMTAYTNLHFALEKLSAKAAEELNSYQRHNGSSNILPTWGQGPRVMIIGPEDAGKTSLVKLLTGYAIRQGRKPCVVNLDPKEGVLSLPGTLTATSFSTIMDVELDGWGSSPTSGPSAVPVKLPLVYFYGFDSPEKNPRLYKKLTSRMALAVTSRLGEDRDAQASGLILDTPSSLSQPSSYDLIHHLVADFSITVLAIVGSERLYSDMARRYSPSTTTTTTVIKLAKSGGVVDRPDSFLKAHRFHQIKSYFFGEPKRTLSPYTMTVDFSTVKIFRLIDPHALSGRGNTSFLPGGGVEDDYDPENLTVGGVGGVGVVKKEPPLVEKVEEPYTRMELMHRVLAVMGCDIPGAGAELGELAEASVLGFVYVVDVEEGKRRVRLLAPVAGRLPVRPLVIGGGWPEVGGSLVG